MSAERPGRSWSSGLEVSDIRLSNAVRWSRCSTLVASRRRPSQQVCCRYLVSDIQMQLQNFHKFYDIFEKENQNCF